MKLRPLPGLPNSKSVALLLCAGLLAAPAAFGAATYAFTDLGNGGGLYGIGNDVNNSGQATGYTLTTSGHNHGFLYSAGVSADLGTDTIGFGINSSGQIAGARIMPLGYQAFVYGGGTMTMLPIGANFSMAYAINNNGQIVGIDGPYQGNSNIHGYVYNAGVVTDLGGLGGDYTSPFSINIHQQIVGYSRATNGVDHAFLYSGGHMTDLGTFWGTSSGAEDINDSGQIVGQIASPSANSRAFLYQNGQMHELPSLGGTYSDAVAINNAGQIVGYAQNSLNQMHAFLYFNGAMSDLNDLIAPGSGWTLTETRGISDNGQIVGLAVNGAGDQHGFLLTPIVPEPTGLTLLSLGVAGLLCRQRRPM